MRKVLTLLFSLLLVNSIFCQNTIGIPNIVNYPKQTYHAGSQNFDIKQDSNGIMYFANSNGLLSFDGTFWRTYTLPNKTTVRSVAIGSDNKIYVGGQEEFGYFSANKNGELIYTSLKQLIPKQDNDFADVWNIYIFQNNVFFRSNRRIFELANNKITVFKSINWSFLGSTKKELIAYNYEKGLVKFINGNWLPAFNTGKLNADANINATIDIGNDSTLIISLADGAFILHNDILSTFETPVLKNIASKIIFKACLLNKDKIALATSLAGCFIIDKKGELIQKISKQDGIQNNNILSAFLDKNNNLWLGLDNGIDFITYNSAVKNIFPELEDHNSGFASIIYHHQLYLGTSSGVYKTNLDSIKDLSYVKSNFNFIENTKGRVWNFSEVNDKLLVDQNKGAFVIDGNIATPLDVKTGFWTFQPLYQLNPSPVVIAGTYNGINFYNYKDGKFTNPGKHAQFESARFVAIKDSIIWIAHPYKGLYKVSFYDTAKPIATAYVDKNGVLSANHNHIYKIKDKIILTSDKGIFELDNRQQDFVPSIYYRKIFDSLKVSYLKEDQYGNIWFCIDKKLGIVDMSGKMPKIIYVPEMNDKIMAGGFENVNIIDSNNAFIAAEKGFYHLNYAQYKKSILPIDVLIRKIISPTLDSLIYGGYVVGQQKIPEIVYAGNSLHFEFSSTLYGQEQNIEYSYYLKDFDKGWSDWQIKREKDYTNLPAGNYIFQVKCRNNTDNESSIATYSFNILPPWYQTVWAYLLYVILFATLIYLFYKRQQKKYKYQQTIKLKEQQKKYDEEQRQLAYLHELEIAENEKEIMRLTNEKLSAEIEQKNLEEEQKRLQYLHQIEVEQNDKKIIALTNSKLQSEIEHKNTELASSAMNLVQKMELLSKIKEDLNKFKHNVDIEKDSKEFQKIIRVIDKELDHNQEWEQFAVHFDSVHTNYLKNLKTKFPDLTASELKLCAYLRLSLSTKEIAQLMNISIRGVETSRYRLRKKMNLSNEANLFDSLINVG